jgi:hypothetical protein
MENLKEKMKSVLAKKDSITRDKVLEIKLLAKRCKNPEICSALSHILEDTSSKLSHSKVQKLEKLYKSLKKS